MSNEDFEFSKSTIQKYKTMFQIIDKDGDNHISVSDLHDAFNGIGHRIEEAEVKNNLLGEFEDKKIDFNAFLRIVGSKFGGFSSEEELKDAFSTFVDSSGNIEGKAFKEDVASVTEAQEDKQPIEEVIDEFTKENRITGYKKVDSEKFIDNVKI